MAGTEEDEVSVDNISLYSYMEGAYNEDVLCRRAFMAFELEENQEKNQFYIREDYNISIVPKTTATLFEKKEFNIDVKLRSLKNFSLATSHQVIHFPL